MLSKMAAILAANLARFYQKLDIIQKQRKLKILDARHVEYDIIKYFAAFCQHAVATFFLPYLPKKRETHAFLFKTGLTACHV